jgi:hypothetical protein
VILEYVLIDHRFSGSSIHPRLELVTYPN